MATQEEILRKLREAEVELAKRSTAKGGGRKLGVTGEDVAPGYGPLHLFTLHGVHLHLFVGKNPPRKWMVDALDAEAHRLGVTRQSVIKVWIAERLEQVAARAPAGDTSSS